MTFSLQLESNRLAESNSDRESISGPQLRAARALLKWSVRELSTRCGVSQSAIARSEKVDGTPTTQVRNLAAIRRVFEEQGIEFLGLDGVRLLLGSSKIEQPRAAMVNSFSDGRTAIRGDRSDTD